MAEAVTDRDPEASALVITGSAAALGEERHDRIDIVKLPELSRDSEGDLHAARLGMDTSHLHELRAHLAFAAAETFAPSVVVVDKTPLGLNDELVPTLEALRAKRTKIVLGLRDIEDAPDAVRDRWFRANLREPINRLYDGVLIYGPQSGATDALACMEWDDLDVPVHHVGYVGSPMPDHGAPDLAARLSARDRRRRRGRVPRVRRGPVGLGAHADRTPHDSGHGASDARVRTGRARQEGRASRRPAL